MSIHHICETKTLRLRAWLFVSVLLCLAQPLQAQMMGANFNERWRYIDEPSLTDSNVNWTRAFVNMSKLVTRRPGQVTGIQQSAIDELDIDTLVSTSRIRTGDGTMKMIFTLKYRFKDPLNRVPDLGSDDIDYLVEATKQVLDKSDFGSHIDILVVGNEPMFETPYNNADIDRLADFTRLMINRVQNWRNNNAGWNYDIYVGALNNFSTVPNNKIRNTILNIAKNNNKVDGLDMHIHARNVDEIRSDLRMLRNVENFEKEVIVSEFSIQRLFSKHKKDTLGSWGPQNGYPGNLKVWQWINRMLEKSENGNPVDRSELRSYFNSQNWYPKDWFQRFYKAFIDYDVKVGMTAFIRGIDPGFRLTQRSKLWVLNGLRNEALLGRNGAGLIIRNPLNYPQFKKIVGPFDNKNSFRIVSKRSQKSLDVSGCSTDNGANVQQWNSNNAPCQEWRVELLSAGEYRITSVKSGLALEVGGCSTINGANVQQWPWNGADCQRWLIQPLNNNDYRIISKRSGKALDVRGCSNAAGANVQQWRWNGADCQRWIIR